MLIDVDYDIIKIKIIKIITSIWILYIRKQNQMANSITAKHEELFLKKIYIYVVRPHERLYAN